MKPSERIKEIIKRETYNDKQVGSVVEAIILVLDEQYSESQLTKKKSVF